MAVEKGVSVPSTIYAKAVKVCTIEFIKQQIVFCTLINTKKTLSLDFMVAGAGSLVIAAVHLFYLGGSI